MTVWNVFTTTAGEREWFATFATEQEAKDFTFRWNEMKRIIDDEPWYNFTIEPVVVLESGEALLAKEGLR